MTSAALARVAFQDVAALIDPVAGDHCRVMSRADRASYPSSERIAAAGRRVANAELYLRVVAAGDRPSDVLSANAECAAAYKALQDALREEGGTGGDL